MTEYRCHGPDSGGVARDLIADIRRLDEQFTANAAKMTAIARRDSTSCATSLASERSSLPVCWAAPARGCSTSSPGTARSSATDSPHVIVTG